MALSKNTYVTILCLAFLYSVMKSYLNVLDEPTTFEEIVLTQSGIFPSITFCQLDWSEDEFNTMEDIMDAINTREETDYFTALFYHFGKGTKPFHYDIRNFSVLSSELNVTYREVWSHGVQMQDGGINLLTLCTTLNFPFVSSPPKQGTYGVKELQRICLKFFILLQLTIGNINNQKPIWLWSFC